MTVRLRRSLTIVRNRTSHTIVRKRTGRRHRRRNGANLLSLRRVLRRASGPNSARRRQPRLVRRSNNRNLNLNLNLSVSQLPTKEGDRRSSAGRREDLSLRSKKHFAVRFEQSVRELSRTLSCLRDLTRELVK